MRRALYLAEILIWGNVPYTAGLEKCISWCLKKSLQRCCGAAASSEAPGRKRVGHGVFCRYGEAVPVTTTRRAL